MECSQVKALLGRYIDNELNDEERKAVQEHVSICPNCAGELETLKSIHTAGQTDYIPEPEPQYWKQLTQNIKGRIAELEKRPAEQIGFFDRVKNIFWPSGIGYRLVGLTATAMIVLVVIHYTFFPKGKFDLPMDMTGKKAAQITDTETIKPDMKKEDTSRQRGMQTPATEEAAPAGIGQKRRPSSVPAEPEARKEEPAGKGQESLEEAALAPKKTKPAERKDKSYAIQSVPAKQEETGVASLAKPVTAERETADIQTHERDAQILRTKMVADDVAQQEAGEDASAYMTFLHEAQSTDDIHQKKWIWETFLQTHPTSPQIIKAKVELAQLYYQLAKEKKTETRINEALQFYEQNIELFESEDSYALLKKQMEALSRLLEEIKKN